MIFLFTHIIVNCSGNTEVKRNWLFFRQWIRASTAECLYVLCCVAFQFNVYRECILYYTVYSHKTLCNINILTDLMADWYTKGNNETTDYDIHIYVENNRVNERERASEWVRERGGKENST